MTGSLLSGEQLGAALAFIEEDGRPLEVALARLHFGSGTRDQVLEALAAYQNDDGGFGRALEPDLRAPESSAICTAVAFQVLREIGAVREAELAKRAWSYLIGTLDRDLGNWRIVPPSVETSPHAPWWNQTGRDHGYDTLGLCPTAELLGYLYERQHEVDRNVLDLVTRAVMGHLAEQDEVEMHDLLCCLRLFASPGLPAAMHVTLQDQLTTFVDRAVVRDPRKWASYGLRPLQVAEGPASPFLPGLADEVESNLDYEVSTQQADGSWAPNWTWGEAYPEVWPTARREWSGVVTLRNLLVLRRFGRIEVSFPESAAFPENAG